MLRPRVLVVDHQSEQWKNVSEQSLDQPFELHVLEDGMEAYMELSQAPVQTVLIRDGLPGVTGTELAEYVLDEKPDSQVVMFDCGDRDGSSSTLRMQRLDQSPSNPRDAARFLEEIVSPASPV